MSEYKREYQENIASVGGIKLLVWPSRVKVKFMKEEEINLVFKKEYKFLSNFALGICINKIVIEVNRDV